MFRRRDRPLAAPELLRARDRFREVAGLVDEAKATLLLGVPSGRVARLPLAEALAAFEEGLKRAGAAMDGWRAPEVEPEWEACRAAVDEAALRAERLRVRGGPQGYEELAAVLDELLDALEAFGSAGDRFGQLGA